METDVLCGKPQGRQSIGTNEKTEEREGISQKECRETRAETPSDEAAVANVCHKKGKPSAPESSDKRREDGRNDPAEKRALRKMQTRVPSGEAETGGTVISCNKKDRP